MTPPAESFTGNLRAILGVDDGEPYASISTVLAHHHCVGVRFGLTAVGPERVIIAGGLTLAEVVDLPLQG